MKKKKFECAEVHSTKKKALKKQDYRGRRLKDTEEERGAVIAQFWRYEKKIENRLLMIPFHKHCWIFARTKANLANLKWRHLMTSFRIVTSLTVNQTQRSWSFSFLLQLKIAFIAKVVISNLFSNFIEWNHSKIRYFNCTMRES